jgi:hypothetical protein
LTRLWSAILLNTRRLPSCLFLISARDKTDSLLFLSWMRLHDLSKFLLCVYMRLPHSIPCSTGQFPAYL